MKHNQLTKLLIDRNVLANKRLINAFDMVDRRDFLPVAVSERYLENVHLPIGYSQSMTQPFSLAFVLELVLPVPGERILEIGTGSGWSAALMAACGADVYSVETEPGLVRFAQSNLRQYADLKVAVYPAGDELGLVSEAPFDKIVVSGQLDAIPEVLLSQLKPVGRLVVPVNDEIKLIEKTDDGVKVADFKGFSFTPLKQL